MIEEERLPISALQHLIFCERQCALIHVERLWAENRLTIEGQHLHERAHDGADEVRSNVIVTRGLKLKSAALGLFGVADVVELTMGDEKAVFAESTAKSGRGRKMPRMNELKGRVQQVLPVEYKRGKPKKDNSDRVQLAAQAMCLEEMFDVTIAVGHLYYGQRRRRTEVSIDKALRLETESAVRRLHEMIRNRETPRADLMPKCKNCSLVNLCLPGATQPSKDARRFFQRQLAGALASDGPETDFAADGWSEE